ncbi:hypothetical protein NQ315_003170 [Exocentrus adspersus]|uniref:Secreted protein n=1 Tax=Exocentrus adspersus TaxID=1586481 RepID=A0AAV8W4M7_9CUCU|nr:hypothetical protein NQ315_003170 [Exocentrus adspersus]
MKIQKFSFVFLAFLMVHQIDCKKGDDTGDIVVIQTEGLKIVEAVVDVVTKFLSKSIEAVTEAEPTVRSVIRNVQKYFINTLWDITVDQLNEFEGLSENKKHAIECIKLQGPNLTGTVLNFTSDWSNWKVKGWVLSAINLESLVNLTQVTNEEMKSLTKELDECVNAEDVQACSDEVSSKLLDVLKIFAYDIQVEANKTTQIIQKIGNFTELMQQDSWYIFKGRFQIVSNAISKCIEKNSSTTKA